MFWPGVEEPNASARAGIRGEVAGISEQQGHSEIYSYALCQRCAEEGLTPQTPERVQQTTMPKPVVKENG